MTVSRYCKYLAASALAAFMCVPAAVADGGKFDIGITGGWTELEGETSFRDQSAEDEDSGLAFGIVARYTLPVSDSGTFFGLHASWQSEPASFTDEAIGTVAEAVPGLGINQPLNQPHTASATSDAKWSADLLARIGHDFGAVAPYIAGGLSVFSNDAEYTVTGPQVNTSGEEGNRHVGWKVALGADVDVAENWVMFVQGEYAKYGEETYFDEFEVDGKTLSARLGLAYRF